GREPCVPVSWGDVATAFYSTGVENITVYIRRTTLLRSADVVQRLFGRLLRTPFAQRALAAVVHSLPEGPSPSQRARHRSIVWAHAVDSLGRPMRALLSTPDPYEFTASSALEIAWRIGLLRTPLGLVTPSQAFGADFVIGLPGCV